HSRQSMTSSYDILPTPYGGRGAFAREAIPKGSPILFCPAPYAAVVYWKFRREACATCYGYAFESGRNKWSVKLGGDKGQGGVWFCSEVCKDAYVEMQQNGLKLNINPSAVNALDFLQNIKASDITSEFVDRAWSLAEEVTLEECRKKTGWTEVLTEFEVDTAQFVLDGLVRKTIEDVNLSSPIFDRVASSTKEGYSLGAGRWADFMGLQDNELSLIKSKPYLLMSRILVYRFLKYLAASLPLGNNSLATSAHARALMARDYGNVFGIWDEAKQDEGSEMLGWGAYVFGSYFNHNCAPNLKKRRDRQGIQFYTLRDVSPGEELCISYIDEDSHHAKERGEQLKKDWFFVCGCARCTAELPLADAAVHIRPSS
ncbi:hypothetical protein CPB84DRAFT_1685879, partial [Gymnopilus junonius]